MIRELLQKWLELPAGKLYSNVPGLVVAIVHFATWADQQAAQHRVQRTADNVPNLNDLLNDDEDRAARGGI